MIKNSFRFLLLTSFILSSTSFAARAILEGLQNHVNKHHGLRVPLTGDLDGKALLLDFDFLEPEMEATLEGEDLFIHNWKKNQNTMARVAKETGIEDFANREGFTAVSIGSSSSQAYHFDGKDVKTFQWFLGTDDFGKSGSLGSKLQLASLLAALSNIKSANNDYSKPIVFMNSIAFASPVGVTLTGFDLINLSSGPNVTFLNPKDEGTNILANDLVELLTRNWKIYHAFLLKTKNKSDKILNKWTNSLVQRLFAPNELGFVGDMGGSGFSLKLVENRAFDDAIDYISKFNDKNDKYLTKQDEIVKHFENDSIVSEPNVALDDAIQRIIRSASAGLLEESRKSNPAFKDQEVFRVVIRQSGKLRKLFLDNGGTFRVIPTLN